MCLASGLAIGTSHLDDVDKLVAGIVFVAVSASTVAIPILAYTAAGDRLDDLLERVRDWMEKNNAALLAVIVVLIGCRVLPNGIRSLYARVEPVAERHW